MVLGKIRECVMVYEFMSFVCRHDRICEKHSNKARRAR